MGERRDLVKGVSISRYHSAALENWGVALRVPQGGVRETPVPICPWLSADPGRHSQSPAVRWAPEAEKAPP